MNRIASLPIGWQLKKLGEVCQIIMGQSPPSNTYNSNGIGLPFFQGKAEFTELYPIVEKWCDTPNKIAEPNDILLSVRAPVGTTNLVNVKCCIGRGLAAIRFDNYKYVFYFLKSIEQELDSKGTGTTFRAISGETIRNTEIPIPTPLEQQAIVAKIEELLSELENGKQQLLTAQQQLKVYRQSLLKWAFEGKEQTIVGELFDFVGGGTPSKKIPEYWQGNIPWASVKDVKGDYLKHTQDRISAAGLKDSASNLAKPKEVILITRISPGKTIITNIETAINQDLKIVKPKFETTPKFIFYVFKSIEWECVKKSSGTTVLGINLTNLKEISVPKLNLKEQQIIVDELESKLTVCDRIEETISHSLKQSETLRQSILKKAFEGKLV